MRITENVLIAFDWIIIFNVANHINYLISI
jgi:hypothetical protein